MATDGYPTTPMVRRLGVRPGHIVHLVHRPPGWDVPDLPEAALLGEGGTADADVTVAFYRSCDDLRDEVDGLLAGLADSGVLWIAWPRRAAGHDADITGGRLRSLLLPHGLVDVKTAVLGEDWSGLKFVRRRSPHGAAVPAEPPTTGPDLR